MKTRKFQWMAALVMGMAMTCVMMTSCTNEDNPVDIPGGVPNVGGSGEMKDGNWTYIEYHNNIEVTGYTGSDKETLTTLDFPLKLGGKDVTNFSGEFHFSEFKNLETLNFDAEAYFYDMPNVKGCSKLQHINYGKEADKLPKGINTIIGQAFRGTAIKNIDLNRVRSIGNLVFDDCDSLESVNIPEAKVSLGEDAFAYIPSKCTITLNCSVNKLTWRTVSYSPQIIVECSDGAMGWCGDGGKGSQEDFLYWKIDDYNKLYIDCPQQGIDNFPDMQVIKTRRWEDYLAKYEYNGITELHLSHVYAIGKEVFKNQRVFDSVDLNDGLTSIGESAFEDCTSLKSITIPASVTSIGSKAFAGCKRLEKVIILGNPTIAEDAFYNVPGYNQ